MLRTQSKEKIAKGHSYPVGTEVLSAALRGVPQYESIALSFWYKDEFWASSYNEKLRNRGEIKVLRAEYGSTFREWRIHISSVPSAVKHQVSEAIVQKVLPALKASYLQLGSAEPDSAHQCFNAVYSLETGQVKVRS